MGEPARVFIHTNHRQRIGALVSEYSLRRHSRRPDAFDIEILSVEDHRFIRERDGQKYLREGDWVEWRDEDLQSFTPLRFLPPERMGHQGRALVIDPDVFAVGDVMDLLERDLDGKAIGCRARSGAKGLDGCLASSVMLLDCARLGHWRAEEQFGELFEGQRDYAEWICLKYEPRESIELIENRWNDFDHLTPSTGLLHNTKRLTQPWKTGLPIDFRPAPKRFRANKPKTWLKPLKRVFGDPHKQGHYAPHPDPAQERFFFGLLRECLEKGVVSEDLLREEMARDHVRHDALEVIERTPPLAA